MVLRAPDGARTVLHSSDTFTWLQGRGRCEPSSTQCCDFDDAPSAPVLGGVAAGTLALAAQPAAAGQGGSPETQRSTSGGCSVSRAQPGSALWLLALCAPWPRARRRQRSTGAPSRIH
jgi:MYXO-CTERM domain-containing protein